MKKILGLFAFFIFSAEILMASPKSAEGSLEPGPMPSDRPSVALVLAGGGAKGFAHLPVIELLEQMDIPIDMVVGTSIGSIIGGLYSSGYTPLEISQEFEDMDWMPIFADADNSPYERIHRERSSLSNLINLNLGLNFSLKLGTGLSNGQNIYQLLKEKTVKIPSDKKFNELSTPFRAVVCDMFTGDALVLDEGDIAEAIRASMSLPAVFAPYEIDGKFYMDGGIRYNLAINVAKNMGYDIIIAIDISQKVRDSMEVFSSNPMVAVLNTITISQYSATERMYKDADLVVFPDISNYGTLDFKQSKSIYEEGKKVLEKYVEPLEKIRKRIYPEDYDRNGKRISPLKALKERGSYDELPFLVPEKIEINGAFLADEKHIKNSFQEIAGLPLEPDTIQRFFNVVRSSGNYKSVASRIVQRDGKNVFVLNFTQVQTKSAKLFIDLDSNATLSTRTTTMLDLIFDVQYRGLTGNGSVMSLRAKTINDYGLSFYYFQPISSVLFAQVDAILEDDRYPELPVSFSGSNDYSEYSSIKNFRADFLFGMGTKLHNLAKIGLYYNYFNTREADSFPVFYDELYDNFLLYYLYAQELGAVGDYTGEYVFQELSERKLLGINELTGRSFGFLTEYEFDAMDRLVFARDGFYGKMSARYAIPINSRFSANHSLIVEADFRYAKRFNKIWGLNCSVFLGGDVLDNLDKSINALLAEGFNYFDRIYFPQICGAMNYGANKIATSFAFQIEPWKNLTIMGGDLILRVGGTVGNVVNEISNFIPRSDEDEETNPLLWTGYMGIALKIKTAYSLYLRFGMCSTAQKAATPFLAMDLGSIRF